VIVPAPPKPPSIDDLRERSVEALREQALIEEARQRARKRRQRYAAIAVLGAVAAVAVVGGFGRVAGGRSAGGSGGSSGGIAAGAAAGNGKIAFVVGAGALYLVNPDGSGLHVGASCHVTSAGCGILEPAWSPGGKRLAFVRGRLGWPTPAAPIVQPSRMFLYVEDADGGAVLRLASCGSCAAQWRGGLSWSPDGSQIAFSRDSGSRGQESLWVVDLSGKLRRLADCLPRSCSDVSPAWSPNGKLIVFSRIARQDSGLYTVLPDGSQLTRIATGTDPQWSPGGQKIAYDSGDSIFSADPNGSHRTLLLAGSGGGSGPGVPSWSPDGKKLTFIYTPERSGAYTAEVWTINSNGSAKQRLYHSACCVGSWAAPIWSPDGTKIAFAADSAHGTYVINTDGSNLHRLSAAPARELTWQHGP
jgi:Tol biopolymer transport system component